MYLTSFILVISTLVSELSAITTTHNGSTANKKLTTNLTKKTNGTETILLNERQRRLIPYMTFYLSHDFNRPTSHSETGHYRLVPQKITIQPYEDKYIVTNYQTEQQQQQQPPQYVPSFTPFLENNKLPGGFTPMRPQPIRVKVLNTPPVRKEPNYSAIFDKLLQLKQENNRFQPNPQQYYSNPRPAIKFVPDFTQTQQPLKNDELGKTYIHTYTPEHIDITTDSSRLQNYERFESLKTATPAPILIPEQKTFQPIIIRPVYRPIYQTTETPQRIENPNSLSLILKQLQDSNTLPQTLTPDNIDNSIKTLVQILNALKQTPKFQNPIVVPHSTNDGNDYDDEVDEDEFIGQNYPAHTVEGGTPGKPGIDYPAYSFIPQTSFNCKKQRYKGFFGDPDTNCQVWHYCDLNGGQASFLCPNGTIFSQVALTCDWWYNVKCATTTQLYVLNERLYKYILPFTPKFPEDYSGPLVDRYLALKFKEMEEKMMKQKKEKTEKLTDDTPDAEVNKLEDIEETVTVTVTEAETHEQPTQTTVVTDEQQVSHHV